MTPKPDALQFGNFQIPTPCSVPWEEMDPQNRGNRYCQACQKVVHDLTGMSEAEIAALFRSLGGSLCGSIEVDEAGEFILFRGESAPPKARFLKQVAVAASMLLLYQVPQMHAAMGPKDKEILHLPVRNASANPAAFSERVVTPATNTLISGVILTQDSVEIRDELVVDIYVKGVRLAQLISMRGFFHHDFGTKLKPTDKIKIVVVGKTYNFGKKYEERKYQGTTLETTLGNAQNIQATVQYTGPKRHRRMGAVRF